MVLRALAAMVLALGFQPVLAGMSPASAAPVSVDYTCRSTVFGIENIDGPQQLSIDFDLDANVGDLQTFNVPLGITGDLSNFPFAVSDAQVVAQVSVSLYLQGGPLVTTPTAVGTASATADLAPNADLPIDWPSDLLVSTAGFASGDIIEARPSTITLQYTSPDAGVGGTLVSCTPDEPTTVIATSNVFASSNSCTAAPRCNVVQNLNLDVVGNANGLTLQELDNATGFGTLQTAPVDQQISAALDDVQVQDVRGSDVGWSLTAFATGPFVGGANPSLTIPSTALSVDSVCNAVTTDMDGDTVSPPTSGSTCTPGAAGALPGTGSGSSIVLASSANAATGTGGTWRVPLGGTVNVPAFQGADTYSMVLTIVLTSN